MNSEAIALNHSGTFDQAPGEATPHHHRGGGIAAFARHFAEMVVAMMAGMMLFGMPLAAVASLLFGPEFPRIPEVRELGMAISMTVPMVAWMRFRDHSWRASIEMGAAMILPTLALLPLYWMDLIARGDLAGLGHLTMLPAMLAAMLYRRHEYGL